MPVRRSAATAAITASRLPRSGYAGRRMPRNVPVPRNRRRTSQASAATRAGTCFVKTGLDRSRGFGERAQVAPFVPGSARRARDRRDHRDRGVSAHGGTDVADQRRDQIAAPAQIGAEFAVGAGVGDPESLGHVVGQIDLTGQIQLDVIAHAPAQRRGVDAGLRCALHAVLAETEAELIFQPPVPLDQRELVMEAVRIGQKPRRLQRQAAHRIVAGDVLAQAERVGARRRRGGAEIVHVAIAERVRYA